MADMVMPSGDHAHADRPDHHDGDGSPDRLNTPCVFSSLSTPALSPVDPLLLAIAIAFIIATVFRVTPPRIAHRNLYLPPTSAERRVGKACVSTCRCPRSPST